MKTILFTLFAVSLAPAASAQLSISFEELGMQPAGFSSTVALSNQIAGAVFSGPAPLDGGAILDAASNFGVAARSGANFLAFNRLSFITYLGGGHPMDPETITFAQSWGDVSIWAAGGYNIDTFTMRAFNSAGAQIGVATLATQDWAELRIQAPGIVRVELTQVGDEAFLYDDLSASSGSTATVYCTASTTTNGCVPSIAGSGALSASAATSFTVDVNSVEGQRTGLIFYGVDNTGFMPLQWSTGSTSFLCVKSPTQRSLAQSSGGTNGVCDGLLTLDWNAFGAANPSALGQPFSAGQHVYLQAWFRDPPAPKTTNLSDALDVSVQP